MSRWIVVLALGVLGVSGCGTGLKAEETEGDAADRAASPAVLLGTVIEAGSGKPVAGAWIEAPSGERAETDENGRFRLQGVPLGTEGFLQAGTEGGLIGKNLLRPVTSGELEIVIYLRPDPTAPKAEAGSGR